MNQPTSSSPKPEDKPKYPWWKDNKPTPQPVSSPNDKTAHDSGYSSEKSTNTGNASSRDVVEQILRKYSFSVQELHAGVVPFDDGVEASRYRAEAKQAIEALLLEARVNGQFYYLHQIKEAVASGADVYERIDQLEAETRKAYRSSIIDAQLSDTPKGEKI